MLREQKTYDGKTYLMDVTSDQFIENPYKFYKIRRQAGDVIQVMEHAWSVGSLEMINKILSHQDFGRAEGGMAGEFVYDANPIMNILRDWMLFKNPPAHTRLRKLVLKAFTPKRIRSLEPMIRQEMSKLVEEIKSTLDNEFDVVSSISYPLPVAIISELMGIPQEDRHLFRKWSTDFALALASEVTALPDQLRERLNRSAVELTDYFVQLIDKKKNDDTDDLVTVLLRAKEDDDQLSTAEVLSNCTLLLVAGHETTTSLISNGVKLLLDHPDQYRHLKSHPDLIENAIEEFLRYDPPVQSVGRMAHDEVTIDGYTFPKGDTVSMILGGAGRDPEANKDPDRFDITRKEINHISFGKGIHYCLGANLARLEAKIAFEMILQEFGILTLVEPAERNKNWLLRGYKSLKVRYSS